MTDADVWEQIKGVTKAVGISGGNFDTMKSRGRLPEKWVTPVYLALKKDGKRVSLERLHELTKQ